MYDVIIDGGLIIDGSGEPGYKADLGIKDGKVASIGGLSGETAKERIDARGRAVTPGFIDTHVHSDVMLLADRQHEAGLRQGITTEILGQDGLSYAPLSPENLQMYRWYLSGLNGNPDIDWDWSSVAEFRARFDQTVAINTAYQVPHSSLRLETVGFRDVPLRGRDLEKAKEILATGFEEGAVALSTGLSYYPNSFSDTEELVELCRVAAEYDRPFVIHTRSVYRPGEEPQDWIAAGMVEALEIGRRSGVKVHFSHTRTTPANAGEVAELLAPIEKAQRDGVRVTMELYPYPSGAGFCMILLPLWAQEGGPEAIMGRLRDRSLWPKLVEGIEENNIPPTGGVFTYIRSEKNSNLMGRCFEEVARERGLSVGEMVLEVMLEEKLEVGFRGGPPADMAVCEQLNRDFLELISRPYYMVGSDSIPTGKAPHPRTYGTFPRFLRLRRELGGMSLEALINRMTAVPAKTFNLKGRGLLRPEMAADVVVFDPQSVSDTATYEDPKQYPVGISHVLVNGKIAVDNDSVTRVLAGRALPWGSLQDAQ